MTLLFRFNVFGTLVGIQQDGSRWQAYYLGSEGKRRPADFVVPDFVTRDELAQYLADLFHESATSKNAEARELGVPPRGQD